MEFSELTRLVSGHVEARIVQAAVELGVFEAIVATPMDGASIARRLGTDERATILLLNALAAIGLLEKTADRFALGLASMKYLVRNSKHYLGGMIRFDSSLWKCWEQLPEAIRSGEPVRPTNMYQSDRSETEIFIDAMDSLVKARGDAEVLMSVLDWSGVAELLDVGSGPATYPIALCARFLELHATIFDLPATLAITEKYVREAGMMERIRLIAGDYRTDPIPGRYDTVFLSNIIHGEGEQHNLSLIEKLAAKLRAGGRLIVKDHILDENRTTPAVGAIFSLLMLLTTKSGRCYSFNEIEAWMQRAGLSRVERLELPSPLTSSLVIGAKY